MPNAFTVERNFELCSEVELRAREQMAKDWTTFADADRALCVQPSVFLPSYVEWLTCLEMERDVRKMRQQEREAASKSKKL